MSLPIFIVEGKIPYTEKDFKIIRNFINNNKDKLNKLSKGENTKLQKCLIDEIKLLENVLLKHDKLTETENNVLPLLFSYIAKLQDQSLESLEIVSGLIKTVVEQNKQLREEIRVLKEQK